ncbi:hypothetical protein [Mycolicibacter minnesotensis]
MLALSGCSSHPGHPAAELVAQEPSPSSIVTTPASAAPAAVLPGPEALTDVLYRLSAPDVPGSEKVQLIEGAKASDAATIDKFATALKDGGYLPLNLQAAGLDWSQRSPGNVSADVTVTTANPETGAFSFPMEFKPNDGGWQLSEDTAKTLLAFGNARTEGEPAPAP